MEFKSEFYKNYFADLRIGIGAHNSNSIVRKNDIYILTETLLGSGVHVDCRSL